MFNGIVWCEVTTSTTCLVCIEPTYLSLATRCAPLYSDPNGQGPVCASFCYSRIQPGE